jgi:hypothetical protein
MISQARIPGGGAGNQLDCVDRKAGRFEQTAILGNGGEVVVFDHQFREAVMRECSVQGHSNGGYVSVSAHFCDEASTGLKRISDAAQEGRLIMNPMERGVGKDGVKFAMKGELGGVDDLRCDAAIASCIDHLRGCIDA